MPNKVPRSPSRILYIDLFNYILTLFSPLFLLTIPTYFTMLMDSLSLFFIWLCNICIIFMYVYFGIYKCHYAIDLILFQTFHAELFFPYLFIMSWIHKIYSCSKQHIFLQNTFFLSYLSIPYWWASDCFQYLARINKAPENILMSISCGRLNSKITLNDLGMPL